jgi:hypothetical protein
MFPYSKYGIATVSNRLCRYSIMLFSTIMMSITTFLKVIIRYSLIAACMHTMQWVHRMVLPISKKHT